MTLSATRRVLFFTLALVGVGSVGDIFAVPQSGGSRQRQYASQHSAATAASTVALAILIRKALAVVSLLKKMAIVFVLFIILGFAVKIVAFVATGFDPNIDWFCNTYAFYHVFVGALAFLSVLMNFCNGLGFVIDFPCTVTQRVPMLVVLGLVVPVLLGYAAQYWSAIIFDTVPTGEVSFGAGVFSFVAFVNNMLPKIAEVISPEDAVFVAEMMEEAATEEEGERGDGANADADEAAHHRRHRQQHFHYYRHQERLAAAAAAQQQQQQQD